ncbi:hypothetical protein PWP93_36235 [Paraburkholderia sp. A1RI-2L]|uniref:hypothetical protein n=1 Tax=Paraburkholderia sp. A1RI-2L TaxID=3028367 RepID=UPI003B7E6BE5
MGANASRSALEQAVALSVLPGTGRKTRVDVLLHEKDFARTAAVRDFLAMDHDEFLSLVVHLGTQALMINRGLKIETDGRVIRLQNWHP